MGTNESIQKNLFEDDEQRASPVQLPQKEQLAALVEVLLVEIATALANLGGVDDQDHG
ncbi:hypothetical protein [Lichenifustis flavocetrariae]|uniref:Uncharacterized protein n=1 Tax=Lichenifustis flavocetrariae TaxID=2949735 RepID=A0AA42CS85_9HYPH|nr:hypothetical protein [Lichenifustis flavocetrariae]MCW6513235.1 hypothetical protein [Lichenifustis flavocetrariae]